jgi:hypothetical protein
MHHANYSLLASLDPTHEEPEVETQVNPTKEINPKPKPKQGKHWCIKPPSLNFVYLYILFMNLNYALGCRNWIDTLVALRLLSDLSLLTLWLEIGH